MERTELKAMVPHGYYKIIAQKAGTTTQTVSQFLRGNNNNVTIEIAILELLADLAEKKRGLVDRIKATN